MPRNAMTDERYALEPGTVTIYGSFTGGGATTTLSLLVDTGTAEFVVGEVVTSGGVGSGSGTILRIDDQAGLWEDDTAQLTVDAGEGSFTVGETVVGQTSTFEGVVASIGTVTGDWDPAHKTGEAVLILTGVTGTFSNNESVLGTLGGKALANGDSIAHGGTATLILTGVTGTFADDDSITGDANGVAAAADAGTVEVIPGQPTDVKGKGIASIVASDTPGAAGVYTITLEDKWAGLLSFSHCYLDDVATDDWEVTLTSEDVDGAKTIGIVVLKSGTASYSATDEKLYFEIVLASAPSVPSSF